MIPDLLVGLWASYTSGTWCLGIDSHRANLALGRFLLTVQKAGNFRPLQVAVQMELLCLNCFYILGGYEMLGLRWEDLVVVSPRICFMLDSGSLELFHFITIMR